MLHPVQSHARLRIVRVTMLDVAVSLFNVVRTASTTVRPRTSSRFPCYMSIVHHSIAGRLLLAVKFDRSAMKSRFCLLRACSVFTRLTGHSELTSRDETQHGRLSRLLSVGG